MESNDRANGAGVKPDNLTVPQGSTVQMFYVQRAMRVYALPESELKSVSLMNTLASVFFSVASGLFSLAVGIWINSLFQIEMSSAGEILAKAFAPLALFLAMVSGALGIWALYTRGSTLKTIQDESNEIR